jgi:hypothetical protein
MPQTANRTSSASVDFPLPRAPMIQVRPGGILTLRPGRNPPLISIFSMTHICSFSAGGGPAVSPMQPTILYTGGRSSLSKSGLTAKRADRESDRTSLATRYPQEPDCRGFRRLVPGPDCGTAPPPVYRLQSIHRGTPSARQPANHSLFQSPRGNRIIGRASLETAAYYGRIPHERIACRRAYMDIRKLEGFYRIRRYRFDRMSRDR